ncbi:MAG: prepilin-type N-terminal cleavage/methylation domain-containing protein [Pseudomonadales bacterium]|nr:prepilin-type N-terminal cleavage/methylation domain-containing protein [Pseudomonadales bacterium]
MFQTSNGFSLIELTVVLVLLSLTTALVLPNLTSFYSSFQHRVEVDELRLRLSSLSYSAFSKEQTIEIVDSADAIAWLQPAEGWALEVLSPIVVRSSGVCLGGELLTKHEDFEISLVLEPPFCRASLNRDL